MFCRNCGFRLPDGTKFCDKCGANTQYYSNEAQEPVTAPVMSAPVPPPAPAAPAKPKTTASDDKYAEVFADIRRREFKKTVVIPIVSIVVIAALLIFFAPAFTGTRPAKTLARRTMKALCDYDLRTFHQNCLAAPDYNVDYSKYDSFQNLKVGLEDECDYKIDFEIKDVEDMDEDDFEDLAEYCAEDLKCTIYAAKEIRIAVTEEVDGDKTTVRFDMIVVQVDKDLLSGARGWQVYFPSVKYGLFTKDLLLTENYLEFHNKAILN